MMEPRLILGMGRIYDMLNDQENAVSMYKRVIALDSTNIEAIACLGSHYFYCDQVFSRTLICLLTANVMHSYDLTHKGCPPKVNL